MAVRRVSARSEANERYTPPTLLDAIDLEFDLDPCSPGAGKSFVNAKKHYTAKEDGLTSDWEGTVFVNPPNGNKIGQWLTKLAEHGDGIGLVFARTDAPWFQELAERADAVCFISSRLTFFKGGKKREANESSMGSVLFAFGPKAADAVLTSGLGISLKNQEPPAWRADWDEDEEDEDDTEEDGLAEEESA